MAERDPKTGRFPKSDKGPGWGGAKKGFVKNETPKASPGYLIPGKHPKSLKTILDEIDDEQMVGVWVDVALNAEGFPGARVTAVEKLMDRKHGKLSPMVPEPPPEDPRARAAEISRLVREMRSTVGTDSEVDTTQAT